MSAQDSGGPVSSQTQNVGVGKSDPLAEIDAMKRIAEALDGIDGAAVERVLRWALDRFSPSATTSAGTSVSAGESAHEGLESRRDSPMEEEVGDLADLYALCAPRTDAHKILVVSYWLQEFQAAKGIDARRVNDELKHLGHGVGNITRAFEKLIKSKPQLVIQTKKSGTTRQARKSYKVTVAGRTLVETMMREKG